MKTFRNSQKGLTLISLAVILAVIAFFVVLAFKLVPIYVENYSVSAGLKAIKTEINKETSSLEIKEKLMKRFEINQVRGIALKNIAVKHEGSGRRITVNYEVRVPFFSNIDLVVSFNDEELV